MNFEDGKQKEVLFAPPCFIFDRGDLPPSHCKEFQKVKSDIKEGVEIQFKSQEFEADVFQSVKSFILGTRGVN